jgi:hypothetical protein
MQSPVAMQVQYDELRQQTAWINAENWKFEQPAKRYRVRNAIAQALITLANALTPAKKQDTARVG